MADDDKLRIWKLVETTDPSHTKAVTFGRKFTSIDAMYQIKRCTEVFGPVGEGWEYSCSHSIFALDPEHVLAICDVTIGWGERAANAGRSFLNLYGPVRGTNFLRDTNKDGKTIYDEDAPKKAMTDALTKALSHLGFSADVFLGKFDDNKYVAQVTRLHSGQDEAPPKVELPQIMGTIQRNLPSIESEAELNRHYKANEPEVMKLTKPQQNTVIGWYAERKRKLTGAKGKVTDVPGK